MKKVEISYEDEAGSLFECPLAEYAAEISDELWAEWQAIEARRAEIFYQVIKLSDAARARRPRRIGELYDPIYAVKP